MNKIHKKSAYGSDKKRKILIDYILKMKNELKLTIDDVDMYQKQLQNYTEKYQTKKSTLDKNHENYKLKQKKSKILIKLIN